MKTVPLIALLSLRMSYLLVHFTASVQSTPRCFSSTSASTGTEGDTTLLSESDIALRELAELEVTPRCLIAAG